MDPTSQPTPANAAPPAIGAGVVELIRTQRQQVAYALLSVAAVFLLLTVWLAFKAMKPGAAAAAETPVEVNPFDPKEPPKPVEIANPKRGDYLVGTVGVFLGFMVFVTAGSVLMVSLPKDSPDRQRADARLMILLVGGGVGIVLILAGLALFYNWSEAVSAWLDKERAETAKQAWKVLVPLLMIALGAATTFLAILPSRADERNSTVIRRTVYGVNLGLTVLLLLTALVIGNVIVGMRVPNKLDVTEAAITSISPGTEQLLKQMAEPVTVYQIAQEGDRVTSDTRALLDRMVDVNPSKLKLIQVSPTTDKLKLKELMAKYPPVASHGLGVLLTTGPDEKRHAFVREDDLLTQEDGEGGPRAGRKLIFQGESKIARELAFLAEGGKKTVVYVTQGGGELSLGGGGEPAPENRSMSALRAYLEKTNLEVKPLVFDPVAPAVPPDAGVVMIADPRSPFPAPIVAALDKYMTESRGEAGKGKLLVFAGARNGPDGKIGKTGLEPLLDKFGVSLIDRVIMSEPVDPLGWFETVGVPASVAITSRNPIATLFADGIGPWEMCRPLGMLQTPPGGPLQVVPLFGSLPRRRSWVEESIPTDIGKALSELNTSAEVRRRKELMDRPRPLALLVTETPPPGAPGQPPGSPIPRLAVFGAGEFVADSVARRSGGQTHQNVELIGATADWLRERPAVAAGVGTKTYAMYKLSPTADDTRLVLLPLGLALLIVIGLGAGVWVIRRS